VVNNSNSTLRRYRSQCSTFPTGGERPVRVIKQAAPAADGCAVTVRPRKLLLAATLLVVLGAAFGCMFVARHGTTDKPAHSFVLDKAHAAQAAQNLAIGQRALRAARSQLRAALPELEAYAADHGNSYLGMTTARLRAQSTRPLSGIEIVYASRSDYCAESSADGYGVMQLNPGGPIVAGGCAA
jgi:hypothetical protein